MLLKYVTFFLQIDCLIITFRCVTSIFFIYFCICLDIMEYCLGWTFFRLLMRHVLYSICIHVTFEGERIAYKNLSFHDMTARRSRCRKCSLKQSTKKILAMNVSIVGMRTHGRSKRVDRLDQQKVCIF